MARLAISKDYFKAYAALPRKAQRKSDEFLRKFVEDAKSAAIHLEPIVRAVDPLLRSARIGDDYRLVLRAPEQGDVFLVLWADHHDEAYRWAATKQTAVHPATGSLQIFDVSAAAEALTRAPVSERAPEAAPSGHAPPPLSSQRLPASDLFGDHSDDVLFLAGVPRALLPSVRAIATEGELDLLLPHLPPETGEVLTALAAGIALDEALEEVLGRVTPPAAAPAPPSIDVTDVPAALERDTTQRQFRLLDGSLDLDAALQHPLDVWRVFLHPRQRRLATARTKGPTRVLGGAGTGKTVVALHRVAFLVREVFTKPDDRVLLTTFTVNLAHDLRAQLAKLLGPDELARVEVVNLDAWATGYLRSRGVSVRPAFEKEQRQHFGAAHEIYGEDEVSLDFYLAEWRDVIQDQGLATEDDYARAVRKSRGVPLGRAERRRLWPVFAGYRMNLEHAGMMEMVDILRRARAELEAAGGPPRYASVVVDEAQDLSADALRLVRAIAGPERPDDLFLVGDAHQRIYGRPVALSKCGIQVRGRRSQTLRLNYRTTGAICRWSLGVLDDVAVDDLDEGKADRRGYVSLREGPAPVIHASASLADEASAVVATLERVVAGGTPPEAVCIVARTVAPLRDRFGPALERAGIEHVLLEQEEPRLPGVRLASMHRVKGLEFAVVLLVNIAKGEVPLATPEVRSEDPIQRAQALLRERSLLYVAASRARDTLHVFFAGAPSELVARLPAKRPEERAPAPPRTAPPRPEPATSAIDERLAQPLHALTLPTRMITWSDRKGLATVGDLARLAPSALLAERNLGRKSIQDARRELERFTGVTWEELATVPDDGAPPEAEGPAEASQPWDSFRARLSEEQRSVVLEVVDLSARLRTYARAERLVTVGDLAERSRAELLAAGNLGRGSVAELPRVLAAHFVAEAEGAAHDEGLYEAFKTAVERLEPMPRLVATRRSGLGGDSMTLHEIGETLGVTRERVRQLETKLCEQLARQPWARRAKERVASVLREGPTPLADLRDDPFWGDATSRPEVVAFVLESVLGGEARVIRLDEAVWLSGVPLVAIEEAWSALVASARAIPLPAPAARFDELVAAAAERFGPKIGASWRAAIAGQMQRDEGDDAGTVLAFGDTRGAEVLALLRAAPAPMHREEIEAKLGGRVRFPEDVIHFGRGRVGLRAHIPDFEIWRDRLAPDAARLVRELGPDRQWYAGELLDELREEHDIPEWLDAFVLAALLRDDGTLSYLGRNRLALPGAAEEAKGRIFLHEAIETILSDAGEPISKGELHARLAARTGISAFGFAMALQRPQFVRVDGERVGLLARDVPGGAAAIAEAGEQVAAVLARRGRGLSEAHVHEEVRGLSRDHASWSPALAFSVLHADPRFRFSTSGAVGLAEWESTRVPSRLELVRSALDEAGDRVSVEAVLARIEAHHGDRIARPTLIGMAMKIGASVDGEWVKRKPSA